MENESTEKQLRLIADIIHNYSACKLDAQNVLINVHLDNDC